MAKTKKKQQQNIEDDTTAIEIVASRRVRLEREQRMRRVGSVLQLARRRVRNRRILLNERQIFVIVAKCLCEMNALIGANAHTVCCEIIEHFDIN